MLLAKMKKITGLLSVLAIIAFGRVESYASWLINVEKFHISAHGQISCQDCHETIANQNFHPNPADVRKDPLDFFSVDQCLACHDEIMDNLDRGVHGSKKITSVEEYDNCLRCHNPHTQQRISEGGLGQFDPSKSIRAQCGACHAHQSSLPVFSAADKKCMTCHQYFDPKDPVRKDRVAQLCFSCHGHGKTRIQKMTATLASQIDTKAFRSTPHAGLDCTSCHLQAVQFNHGEQITKDCRRCHPPHDEKKTHAAHLAVTCQACHLEGIVPVKDPQTKIVRWEHPQRNSNISFVHHMNRTNNRAFCQGCHFKGNDLGAVSMILPPKSILCMPCHVATFSIGDVTTILSLLVFLTGLIMAATVWFSGSLPGSRIVNPFHKAFRLMCHATRTVFSHNFYPLAKILFLDAFLQNRLYRRSVKRWLIHGLIFFPIVFRFIWGILGLLASIWLPERSFTWFFLNKNHPVTGFVFDLTGSMILLGVILTFLRRGNIPSDHPRGLPEQDRWALGLIGGIVMIGFILEGMRLTITGWPENSGYAVIGYGFSLLFAGMTGLSEIYGYVWYLHAILTGVFFAYLPFSRLMHIIMAPVVLAMDVRSDHESKEI
jgi:nitrate reductase gamma subunit